MAGKPTYEELERRVQGLEKIESEYKSSKEALQNSEAQYSVLFDLNMHLMNRWEP